MKSNQSSIKIKFNKIAKRVVLPESFSDLLATVQKAFAISNFAGHNIGYYDEDADFCQISNEYDYSEAKKYFESFPVNTIVVRVSDATSENLKTENEQVVFDDAYSEVRDDLFFAEVPVTEKKEEVQAEKYEELFFQEVEVHEIPEEQEKQKQQKVTEKVFIEETGEEFYFPSNEELEKSRIFIHEAINNDCVFSNLVNDLNLQVAPLFEKGAQETKEVLSQLFKNAKLGFCEKTPAGLWVKSKQPLPVVAEITTIEAKLGNWQRALAQAYRHHSFASESWVLLDHARSASAFRNVDRFQRLNVGLITISVAGVTRKLFTPIKKRPKSEFHFWRANSAVAQRLRF